MFIQLYQNSITTCSSDVLQAFLLLALVAIGRSLQVLLYLNRHCRRSDTLCETVCLARPLHVVRDAFSRLYAVWGVWCRCVVRVAAWCVGGLTDMALMCLQQGFRSRSSVKRKNPPGLTYFPSRGPKWPTPTIFGDFLNFSAGHFWSHWASWVVVRLGKF